MSNAPLRIFIGFDARQAVSYTVCAASILARATRPVAITPLAWQTLPLPRDKVATGLTPFTWTRFLVPWLCDFRGEALFMDADFMARGDVAELFEPAGQADQAVWVADLPEKYAFERAAVMLFNCEHPDNRRLLPDVIGKNLPVHTRPGKTYEARAPHTIDWTNHVGTFGPEWNHLVGYAAPNPDAKLVHFTQGVPIFPETWDSEHGDEWRGYLNAAAAPAVIRNVDLPERAWEGLMGSSVHAKRLPDGRVVPKMTPEPEAAE